MLDELRDPKVVVVVNVREDEDGDVSVVHGVVTEAGVDSDFAFHNRGSRSLCAARRVRRRRRQSLVPFRRARRRESLLKGVARPPLLASMKFFHRADAEAPEWAVRHIVYGCAEQFAEESRQARSRVRSTALGESSGRGPRPHDMSMSGRDTRMVGAAAHAATGRGATSRPSAAPSASKDEHRLSSRTLRDLDVTYLAAMHSIMVRVTAGSGAAPVLPNTQTRKRAWDP